MLDLSLKIDSKKVIIGIIGLGYVGLPLVREFSSNGIKVIGFDIDEKKVGILNKGRSYIKHIPDGIIARCLEAGFKATSDFSCLKDTDAIIICVPTPLGEHREPDLSYVIDTAKTVSKYIGPDQLVVLKSTTYPGTTEEIVLPILEESGLKAGKDFNLSYSPEREDPGNRDFTSSNIPLVVGGYTKKCRELTCKLYNKIGIKTFPVSSMKVAESAKLLENIYRAVNIALVNELKVIMDRMGIDVFEVIEAANTKPFGFQAFYPGPGLGGHCIPIDPFYLTWKAREYDYSTRFIELAGEINASMPEYVISKAVEALGNIGRAINGARILILGMAYKKNVDDMRESPALKLLDLLIKKGAAADYCDPYIPALPKTRHYNFNKKSVKLTGENLKKYDCIIINTDHEIFDRELIYDNAKLIIDTRNMFGIKGLNKGKIYKA
ncbi:MAG: nucleotide sugar dehydrogenase [Actinobacteria bacterium]|nr:nucleotide sugar dehydrogenase [Actinomycetota bacterium]